METPTRQLVEPRTPKQRAFLFLNLLVMETTKLTVQEDKREREHVERIHNRPSRFNKIDKLTQDQRDELAVFGKKVLEVGGFSMLISALLYCLKSGVLDKCFMERDYASIIIELIQCVTDLQDECYSDHVTLWEKCGIEYDKEVYGWDYRRNI